MKIMSTAKIYCAVKDLPDVNLFFVIDSSYQTV